MFFGLSGIDDLNGFSTFFKDILFPLDLELWFQANIFLHYLLPSCCFSVENPDIHWGCGFSICFWTLQVSLSLCRYRETVLWLPVEVVLKKKICSYFLPSTGNSDVVLVTMSWVTFLLKQLVEHSCFSPGSHASLISYILVKQACRKRWAQKGTC